MTSYLLALVVSVAVIASLYYYSVEAKVVVQTTGKNGHWFNGGFTSKRDGGLSLGGHWYSPHAEINGKVSMDKYGHVHFGTYENGIFSKMYHYVSGLVTSVTGGK